MKTIDLDRSSVEKDTMFSDPLIAVASNKVVIVKPQLLTFNCFPFDLDVKLLKVHLKFLKPRFSKSRQTYRISLKRH